MPWSIDARLPVRFGRLEEAPPGAALLIEGDAPAPPGHPTEHFSVAAPAIHPTGCACCAPRSSAAQALTRLFLARGRGQLPAFQQVLVVSSPDGEAAIRAALDSDLLAFAWFRLG